MTTSENLISELKNLVAKRKANLITEEELVKLAAPITVEMAVRTDKRTKRLEKEIKELSQSVKDVKEKLMEMDLFNKMMEVYIEEKGLQYDFLDFAEQEIIKASIKDNYVN